MLAWSCYINANFILCDLSTVCVKYPSIYNIFYNIDKKNEKGASKLFHLIFIFNGSSSSLKQ